MASRVLQYLMFAAVGATFLEVAIEACNANTQFECENGRCIPLYWRCDGTNHCDNNEDEVGCDSVECTSTIFTWQCASGKCIPQSWVCDPYYTQHCPDGDDQMNCASIACATEHEWQCADTVCIYATYRCDGTVQCPDGSDEANCGDTVCVNDEFQCNSGQCISSDDVCNQVVDCPGEEQEDEENCQNIPPCDEFSFQCDNGVCIFLYQRCDGLANCKHGEDELCGPNCHQCDLWYDPSFQCHLDGYRYPTSCDAGRMCSYSLKRNFRGKLVYTVGCKEQTYCTRLQSENAEACTSDPNSLDSEEKCTFCCDGDYCNSYDSFTNPAAGTLKRK